MNLSQPSNINFDLLQQQTQSTSSYNNNPTSLDLGNFNNLLMTGNYQAVPPPSGNGITLSAQEFTT